MHILIIDDEPFVARSLKRLVGPHQVEIVHSAADALHAIRNAEFDLIFCDLMMPEVSGQQFYVMACEHQPDLEDRFVFITGGVSTRETEEFLSSEEIRVLYKPFDRNALRSMLQCRADGKRMPTSTQA